MNPVQKRKLYKKYEKECECNHLNDPDYLRDKKINKHLIIIGATIGIIAIIWLIVGIVISEGIKVL